MPQGLWGHYAEAATLRSDWSHPDASDPTRQALMHGPGRPLIWVFGTHWAGDGLVSEKKYCWPSSTS